MSAFFVMLMIVRLVKEGETDCIVEMPSVQEFEEMFEVDALVQGCFRHHALWC